MLQTSTVASSTLELLKKLQAEPLLSSVRLVGGTALSLQIGHRESEDLDLFSVEPLD
ncbi:MAG: nucleotidyl transferase AbiEii/AbiGii toxin family protein, partial [Bacteroidales bacterium]|nr:nucleotidyl transferase AbiEii/AbiGii toxin family protein [Bacteroidales bacterium]